MPEILKDILIGLGSGLVSGYLVYLFTKNREQQHQVYEYWMDFLFKVMERNEVYFPSEELRNISAIGGKGSKWHTAIQEILEITNPVGEDKEFTEEGTKLAENVAVALNELGAWAKNVIPLSTCQNRPSDIETKAA